MALKNDGDPKATLRHHTNLNSSVLWVMYRIALGFRHNKKYTRNEQRREDLNRISSCFSSSEEKSMPSVHWLSGTHHSGWKLSVAITTRWRCRPLRKRLILQQHNIPCACQSWSDASRDQYPAVYLLRLHWKKNNNKKCSKCSPKCKRS